MGKFGSMRTAKLLGLVLATQVVFIGSGQLIHSQFGARLAAYGTPSPTPTPEVALTPTFTPTPTPTPTVVTYCGFTSSPLVNDEKSLQLCCERLEKAGKAVAEFHKANSRYPERVAEVLSSDTTCPISGAHYVLASDSEGKAVYLFCSDSLHQQSAARVRPAYDVVAAAPLANWSAPKDSAALLPFAHLLHAEQDSRAVVSLLQPLLSPAPSPTATPSETPTPSPSPDASSSASPSASPTPTTSLTPSPTTALVLAEADLERAVRLLATCQNELGEFSAALETTRLGLEKLPDSLQLKMERWTTEVLLGRSPSQLEELKSELQPSEVAAQVYREALRKADFSAAEEALKNQSPDEHLMEPMLWWAKRDFKQCQEVSLRHLGQAHMASYAGPYLVGLTTLCGRVLGGPAEELGKKTLREGLETCQRNWPYPVLRFLNDEISAEDLLKAAEGKPMRVIEAQAYAAFKLEAQKKNTEPQFKVLVSAIRDRDSLESDVAACWSVPAAAPEGSPTPGMTPATSTPTPENPSATPSASPSASSPSPAATATH